MMDLFNRINLSLTTILLFALSISANHLQDIKRQPFHLSWTNNKTRYDIVYSIGEPLKNVLKLETVASNNLDFALVSCSGYEACLLQDGQFVQSYKQKDNIETEKLIFKAIGSKSSNSTSKISLSSSTCDSSVITITNYCSTHWNPPAHLAANGCNHHIEWHSPISCPTNATNYERPCYMYDDAGKLIDLTPWILSNGSSYEVDTGIYNSTINHFNLNVCNEAHNACGPNVLSCFINEKGPVESGFNNLTSLKYDSKDKTVLLTSLGQYNELCPDHRVKSVVRFVCKNKVVKSTGPKLIRATGCESVVEWQTIHACPLSEIQVPATKCAIKNDALGVDIELKKIVKNSTIEVPITRLNGKKQSMMLGICQGISKTILQCEGKSTSTTTACLLDSDVASSARNVSNSRIVGSSTKSFIRLADNRLYLESYAINKTCEIPMGRNFNVTRQVGTRIEFFCSSLDYDKPTYLGYNDCTYVFEWGSSLMCLESFSSNTSSNTTIVPKIHSITVHPPKLSDKELKINLDNESKSAHEMHKDTLKDSKDITDSHKNADDNHNKQQVVVKVDKEAKSAPVVIKTDKGKETVEGKVVVPPQDSSEPSIKPLKPENGSNRMNKLHKFFMIGLIVMSLAGFVIIIFILDKKTKLRLPLSSIRRQARQAFQPQPVPYTRVGQFNDLDL